MSAARRNKKPLLKPEQLLRPFRQRYEVKPTHQEPKPLCAPMRPECRPQAARADSAAPLGEEFYMLEGITAAENDDLQRRANAVALQVFRRRIKAPAKTMADLRSALQEEGLIRIRMTWLTCSSLWFCAEAGRKLKTLLRETKAPSADDLCYDCFTRAARKIGLKPGIEDVYAHVERRKVEGTVDAVPFAVTSAAVTRMVDSWRDQHTAKAIRARKRTA